jgi:hypothetical protein
MLFFINSRGKPGQTGMTGGRLGKPERASPARYLAVLVTAGLYALAIARSADAPAISLPDIPGALKFAVIGDGGTGGSPQYEVAAMMVAAHGVFPFTIVLMAGDNLYGGASPDDFKRKFEQPYRQLLGKGVRFFASLGNHDNPNQRFYDNFNMKGKRYYTFKEDKVRFFALDSTYMDREQLAWLEKELRESSEPWKICFFHHPIYSSGKRHGSALELRKVLEPLFVRYGVAAVFSGHDHIYERTRPQSGITYFVSGAAGQLRRDNIRPSELTAKGYAGDRHFMLVQIAGDKLYFEAVSRLGQIVDAGELERPEASDSPRSMTSR